MVCEPINHIIHKQSSCVSAGVSIEIPDPEEVAEGSSIELCVNVSISGVLQREANLTIDLIPISTFAGKIYKCFLCQL